MPKKIKAIKKYKLASGREKYEFSIRANKNKVLHKAGFLSYEEAEMAFYNLKQQIINGDVDAELKKIKYEELYRKWLKRYANTVKESTLNKTMTTFKIHILPKFGSKYVDEITARDCQNAIDDWSEKISKYKITFNYANRIMNEALRMDYVRKNPFDKTSLPKTTQHAKKVAENRNKNNFYNREQLDTFLRTAKTFMDFKVYVFFRLLAYSGMRRGEILALNWGDFDQKNNTITISKTLTVGLNNQQIIQPPKSDDSNRTIVLDDITANLLLKWRHELKNRLKMDIISKDQWIFPNKNNKQYSLSKPQSWLKKIIVLGKLPKITLHGFRHTHATILYDENPYITAKDVQKRLGHSNAAITMNIYEHATDNSDKKIISALDRLNKENEQ